MGEAFLALYLAVLQPVLGGAAGFAEAAAGFGGAFALVLASMAAVGLDARLPPFVAGYVLVLAVAGPLAATRAGG
ncbi:hypothetical protein [Actinomadura kijaniata]|uniref:hypothetical protein n=1 Tax=Actinomadura kijaniata TaxID=46161 RepID=UPI00082C6955|nr:hypothetical protein [Actinomadura kijaniata]